MFKILLSPRIAGSWRALLLVAIMSSLGANAQTLTVKGKVTSPADQTGAPGINVILKNTTNGTTTNAEGVYQIEAPEKGVLVFSGIGYQTVEIHVR